MSGVPAHVPRERWVLLLVSELVSLSANRSTMALPGMRPSYSRPQYGSRLEQERRIVQSRGREADQRQAWSSHSQYFRSADVQAAKSSQWTSAQCFDDR